MSSPESSPFHPVFDPNNDTVLDIAPVDFDEDTPTDPDMIPAFIEHPTEVAAQIHDDIALNIEPSLDSIHADSQRDPTLSLPAASEQTTKEVEKNTPETQQSSVRASLMKILGPAIVMTILSSAYLATRDSQATDEDIQTVSAPNSTGEAASMKTARSSESADGDTSQELSVPPTAKMEAPDTKEHEFVDKLPEPSETELDAPENPNYTGQNIVHQPEVELPLSPEFETKFTKLMDYISKSTISRSHADEFFADRGFQNRVRSMITSGMNKSERKTLFNFLVQKSIIPASAETNIALSLNNLNKADTLVELRNKIDSKIANLSPLERERLLESKGKDLSEKEKDSKELLERKERYNRRILILMIRALRNGENKAGILQMLSNNIAGGDKLGIRASDLEILTFITTKLQKYKLTFDPQKLLETPKWQHDNYFADIIRLYDKYKAIVPFKYKDTLEMFIALGVHEQGPRYSKLDQNSAVFAKMATTYLGDLRPFESLRKEGGALRVGFTQLGDTDLRFSEFDSKIIDTLSKIAPKYGMPSVQTYQDAITLGYLDAEAMFLISVAAWHTSYRWVEGKSDEQSRVIASNKYGPQTESLSRAAQSYFKAVSNIMSALASRWSLIIKSARKRLKQLLKQR